MAWPSRFDAAPAAELIFVTTSCGSCRITTRSKGTQFSVRSTDEDFLELLRGYLGPFQVPEGTEDAIFQVDCGATRDLPGGKVVRPTANLFMGSLRIFCGPRWEDMAGRLIGGVRDLVTTRADETVRLPSRRRWSSGTGRCSSRRSRTHTCPRSRPR